MSYNPQTSYRNLIRELNKKAIKHTIHEFKSGVIMVDIWYKDLFFVIQIEKDFIGVSSIDKDNVGFDTTPDSKFFSNEAFISEFSALVGVVTNKPANYLY